VSQAPWFVIPRPRPAAARRLVVFPSAGSGANAYRSWAEAVPNALELVVAQLPGRETRFREPLVRDLPSLIEAALPALASACDRPFALFGHSFGALIAFELARRLPDRARGFLRHLAVAGRCAPRAVPGKILHRLSDDDLRQELAGLGGTPAAVLADHALMAVLIPVIRADLFMTETYAFSPGRVLACPIAAFGGRTDPFTDEATLGRWQEETTGPFTLRMFDGGHFFVQEDPSFLSTLLSVVFPASPTEYRP
jgi:surfactin synthase thioesterase subunit